MLATERQMEYLAFLHVPKKLIDSFAAWGPGRLSRKEASILIDSKLERRRACQALLERQRTRHDFSLSYMPVHDFL